MRDRNFRFNSLCVFAR